MKSLEQQVLPDLCAPFSKALKSQRESLNQKFRQQSHLAGGIDGPEFLNHLVVNVDPVVAMIAKAMPECAAQSSLELYDLSLHLFSRRILGTDSRNLLIERAWRKLIPAIAKLVARDTTNVVGTVSNIVFNMNRQPGVATENWLDQMIDLAPKFESTQLLFQCAQVLAWRNGMVQYREPAIQTAKQLDLSVAQPVLGLSDDVSDGQVALLLDRLSESNWTGLDATPWNKPTKETEIQLVRQLGNFRGFDGQFIQPPSVSLTEGSIVAEDTESSWQILADRYGCLVHRIGTSSGNFPPPKNASDKQVQIDDSGNIRWNGQTGSFKELRFPTSWASDGQTLAVTIADSHRIHLLAIA